MWKSNIVIVKNSTVRKIEQVYAIIQGDFPPRGRKSSFSQAAERQRTNRMTCEARISLWFIAEIGGKIQPNVVPHQACFSIRSG
jgi:hypothetical protein